MIDRFCDPVLEDLLDVFRCGVGEAVSTRATKHVGHCPELHTDGQRLTTLHVLGLYTAQYTL